MILLEATNGKFYLCDCNVTDDNEDSALNYLGGVIGWGTTISAFICTHRDADHMRGIKKVHEYFPVASIWDSGHPGTTTNSTEYREYMELKRAVGFEEKKKLTRQDLGMRGCKKDCVNGPAGGRKLILPPDQGAQNGYQRQTA